MILRLVQEVAERRKVQALRGERLCGEHLISDEYTNIEICGGGPNLGASPLERGFVVVD